MVQIFIAICLSLFFLGVTRLITQNWVAAILIAVFVLFFSFFGLSLMAAAHSSDDIETTKERVGVYRGNAKTASRLAGVNNIKTVPLHK